MYGDRLQNENEALITRAAGGDNAAFTELESLYNPLIESMSKRYASMAGSSSDDALTDDFRQESRIALYRAVTKYKTGTGVSFGLFAKVCIRNALVSALRRMSRKKDAVNRPGRLPESAVAGTVAFRSSATLTDEAFLEELSDYESRVLELYISGEKVRAIAASLGKTSKSVSNAICRIKQKARQKQSS